MFDIGWGELLVIGVVALIAIGPKELPGVLRMVGQWIGKIRRMAGEFQGQFQEALREAEMADVKQQMDDVTRELTSHFDPLESVHKELERASDMDGTNASPAPSALAAPAAEPEPESEPRTEPVEPAHEPAALAPSPPEPVADHTTEPQRQSGGSGAA